MKKYFLSGLSVFVLALLLGAGCSETSPIQQENPDASPTTESMEASGDTMIKVPAPGMESVSEMRIEEDGAMEDVSTIDLSGDMIDEQVKTFNVTAKQWEFSPETITVNKDDRVVLNITSEDVTHGFAIPQFDINEQLEAGKTTRIEFVADKTGTYTFFCSVFCGSGHPQMRGTLIVK
jgi:cytochrome c oxidase subunit 2